MLYVMVAAGLAALIGIHELVVWLARRTIRRPWAVLLGPVVGYLFLVGCAYALYSTYGIGSGQRAHVVQEVMPGYDAAGKVEAGDRILEVDGVTLTTTGPTLVSLVEASGGKPVVLTIERAGERRTVAIQPKRSEVAGRTGWLLGIKNRSDEVLVHDTATVVKAAALEPLVRTRGIAIATYDALFGAEAPAAEGQSKLFQELAAALSAPTFQVALGMLLLWGVYAWLALTLLDLVRLWRLSRQPDARSSNS